MKKYDVIYADPPWKQKAGRVLGKYKKENGKQVFNIADNKSRQLPYETMNFNDIVSLNVKDIANKNSVLFMWVTSKYLLDAKKVIKAWGFTYSTTLVWSKNALGGGLGGTFKVSTEYLVFAKRGKIKDIIISKIKGTCFVVKRSYVNGYPCHSKKPDFFYELIEKVTNGSKIELFAREKRENWDSWGNELENDVELTYTYEKS